MVLLQALDLQQVITVRKAQNKQTLSLLLREDGEGVGDWVGWLKVWGFQRRGEALNGVAC